MSGRELGRISGPLLANNLKRNGQNLAFDNTVLYLNVNSNYIGVNTNAPAYALDVNGTTRTTYIDVATQANLANLEFYTNNIQNVVGNITISPHSSGTTVVPQLQATNLLFSGNILSSTNTNGNINIGLTGASTAQIKLNNSVLVSGNLHATGDITWDGNITLGNNVGVDTVTFDAEINSSIIPSANNTDNLGSPSYVWATTYANTVNATTTSATSLSTTSLTGSGTNNLNNNVTIGTTNANTLTINAEINTSLIPNVTNTDTLGSSTNLWNNIYGVTFLDGNITLTSNTIQTTTTNSSLQLKANGTGQVVMSAVNVTNNTTVGGTLGVTGTSTLTNTSTGAITEVGNISQTGNFTTTGTISSGSITASNPLTLSGMTLNGSVVTGTLSNSNLILTPKSGQQVEITSSALVDGNTTVGGTLTISGTSTLTNTSTGAITEVGNINQTGNFTTTGTISSGSITASNPLILPDLTFGSGIVNGGSTVYSTILGTTSNTNLVLTPYTGKLVEFGGSVLVDGNSTVGGTLTVGGTTTLTNTTTGAITETGNINQTGNFTTTGTISSGSITASNPLTLSGMTLNGSVVTGTLSNSNLILTPKSGQQVEITSGAKVDTNLSVGGTLTISGTSTLTNTTVGAVGTPSNITLVGAYNQTGNFTTTGTISSDAITATNPLVLPDLTINNTTITGTTVNTNLVLTPHTGKIVEITSGAKVDQNLSVGGTLTVGGTSTLTNTTTGAITEVGNITQTGNFTTTGTISSGSITSSGTVYLPNMTLSNSTITGIGSSANLIFTPYTGKVVEFVSATTLDQNATIGGTLTVGSTTSLGNTNANAINLTGAYNLTGNATLGAVSSGAITSTGKLTLPDLILSGTPSGVSSTITGIVSNTNLTLTPYSGKIVEITSSATVDQNLFVGGTLTVGGTSTLTNTSANAITLTGAYNLTGNATLGAVSSGSITATNPFISSTVEINGSTITGLASGSNLKFTANAGQVVEVTSDTAFDHNVSVTGTLGVTGTTTLASTTINGTVTQTGDFNQTGNFTTSGNVSTNSITFNGMMDYFDPDNFVIGGNTITVSPTNGSMTFTANGTGSVWLGNDLKINGNTIINDWINVSVPLLSESGIQFIDEIGDEYYSELGVPTKIQDGIFLKPTGSGQVIISSTRSLILPLSDDSKYTLTTNGEIRFNDVNLNVEGYSNSGYVNFINLYSRDQQTYITPEATPGAADNTLRFAVGGTVTTTITSSSLANNNLIVNNAVNITGTTIQSVNNSNNITLYSSGNKTVKFNGFNYIVDNTINTPSSGALTISPTGTGYVQIAGTSGLGIPVGNNANYPSAPVIGTLRYNTTRSYPEVYNGSTWIPAYGTSSQPSATDVQDLVLVYELILGF